jgi:hypothetical protein
VDGLSGGQRVTPHQLLDLARGVRVLHLGRRVLADLRGVGVTRSPAAASSASIRGVRPRPAPRTRTPSTIASSRGAAPAPASPEASRTSLRSARRRSARASGGSSISRATSTMW